MKAIPSTYHWVIKFPIHWEMHEIRGEQEKAQSCYLTELRAENKKGSKARQIEETEALCINPDHPERITYISVELDNEKRK